MINLPLFVFSIMNLHSDVLHYKRRNIKVRDGQPPGFVRGGSRGGGRGGFPTHSGKRGGSYSGPRYTRYDKYSSHGGRSGSGSGGGYGDRSGYGSGGGGGYKSRF
jgi:hypothetical protein